MYLYLVDSFMYLLGCTICMTDIQQQTVHRAILQPFRNSLKNQNRTILTET